MNTRYCLIALALSASPLHAADLTDKAFQEMADRAFQPVIREYDIPGLAVGVTINGSEFYYTRGEASRETKAPVTSDTIFELGSVSKIFNVTLAAVAEQRGLLSLNQPVSTYLPELRGSAFDQITLVNLATHTSGGLPLQVPDSVTDDGELMTYLKSWKPAYKAGTMRSYSNVSIGLLGRIAGERFGGTYRQAAEGRLFPALGLKSTFIAVPPHAMDRYAFGYGKANKPIRVGAGVLDDEAYGVKSTARDMVHLLALNLKPDALAPEFKVAIEKTHTGYFDTAYYTQDMVWEQYAWPVALKQLLDGNSAKMSLESQPVKKQAKPLAPQRAVLMNKTGSTNGFGAYVVLVPKMQIGLTVLANRNYPNTVRAEAGLKLVQALEAYAAK
ncbi:beta-lactamase class C [Rhizobium sp. BK196]|jgi:beta-lactamase class C|uniref:class C beta-lactamase n=1 Tax=Rhizobium sp. BK196 TaxID=2587073 RepID=UPI00161DA895|nr:class C beta-lactamase [Rhizobium sp. BK196]MBB3311105.1 beta-lactamase class C [Rhizobium sp. BK196]